MCLTAMNAGGKSVVIVLPLILSDKRYAMIVVKVITTHHEKTPRKFRKNQTTRPATPGCYKTKLKETT